MYLSIILIKQKFDDGIIISLTGADFSEVKKREK